MLAPETVLQDRYRIHHLIKKGNMGAVYLAEDTRLGNNVALKETFFTSDDALLREQFHREARLLSRLHHTSLPRVIDHFIEESGQFLVMDYIVGKDLMELLEENRGPFPVNTVLGWADQLLDVLIYLHAQENPVVHRDIKPANIKLTPQGKVILLDFGLAKGATRSMLISLPAGTMAYAPIEQVLVQGTDRRSDLYSLGVTLYHLLTSTFPPLAVKRQQALWNGLPDPLQSGANVNPQVPEAVARVLTEAMALTADDRLQTASRMRELMRGATRLHIAAESASPVVFKAQEITRDSYETTVPFQADQRPEERGPTADLADLSIHASAESELAAEKARVKLPAKIQIDTQPSKVGQLSDWLVVAGVMFLIALLGIEVWRYFFSSKPDAPALAKQENVEPQTYTETAGGSVIKMVRLLAGRFTMGSPDGGRLGFGERPQHTVSVKSFYVGKYEVTQTQWKEVASGLHRVDIDLKPDPSKFKGENLPVAQVNWEEATEFCERISRASGKLYRLPTEAEWEYACRATTTGSYAGDLDAMGWYTDTSGGMTHPVGTKQANEFGLYDMHGNVWEWCMDTWHETYDGAPEDGTAWRGDDASRRVLRGGSCVSPASLARSASRNYDTPHLRSLSLGFRVVAVVRTP